MADTRVQLEIENWVRSEWLPQQYGQRFTARKLMFDTGGKFNFDAVSEDGTIVANISTSGATTAGNKFATGKMQKLRADMLFLLMAPATIRLVVLTEKDMYNHCLKDKQNGRIPNGIDFAWAEIPQDFKDQLVQVKRIAALEVSPLSSNLLPDPKGEAITIQEPALLIRINRLYYPGMGQKELYDVTRGIWKVGERRSRAKYALAVYNGKVLEVYQIDQWCSAGTTLQREDFADYDMTNRWEFIGRVASEDIRQKYLNQSVEDYFQRGAANPIQYVNC